MRSVEGEGRCLKDEVRRVNTDFGLFDPSAEFRWVAGRVKYRNRADEARLDVEINAILLEGLDPCLVGCPANETKTPRILKDSPEDSVYFGLEPVTKPWPLIVIPSDSLFKFEPRLGIEDYFPRHSRLFSRRPLSSARIVSQRTPVSGWWRSRSARSSNFAICSGVKSPSISSRISSASLRFSSIGSRRNCSRISVALMRIS